MSQLIRGGGGVLLALLLLACASEPSPEVTAPPVPAELVGHWLAGDRQHVMQVGADGTYQQFDEGAVGSVPDDSGTLTFEDSRLLLVSTDPTGSCGPDARAEWEVLRLDEFTLQTRVIADPCLEAVTGAPAEGFRLNFIRCMVELDDAGTATCEPWARDAPRD